MPRLCSNSVLAVHGTRSIVDLPSPPHARQAMATALRSAVGNAELEIFYRPTVALATGKIVACEALVRWNSALLGSVAPDVFMPLAEETGMSGDIGAWVLEKVCHDIAVRRAAGLPLVPVSVQVSPLQFRDPGMAERMQALVASAGSDPRMLTLVQAPLFSEPLPGPAFDALLRSGACLPAHLLAPARTQRTLLLVDDEVNIVAALKRLLRRDGYRILTAHGGAEGLAILEEHAVDVILSDQRMPGMTGVEFLSIARNRYPDTVRLVLSGYTELQSVTDAVNEGAIYKFLTKPWDDLKLRGHVEEAFQRKESADEIQRLTRQVHAVNLELAAANRQQHDLLGLKQEQIARDTGSLEIVREVLQHVPLAVVAIDDTDMIAFVNDAASRLFSGRGPLLGSEAGVLLPELTATPPDAASPSANGPADPAVRVGSDRFTVRCHSMGRESQSSGRLVVLTPSPDRRGPHE